MDLRKKDTLVVFDYDWVLLNSTHSYNDAFQYACWVMGVNVSVEESQKYSRSMHHTEEFCKLYGYNSEYFLSLFQGYYRCMTEDKFHLFPEVHDTLHDLKRKVHLAILTDKPGNVLHESLKIHNIQHHFSQIVSRTCIGVKKPSPQWMIKITQELWIHPSNTIMIGDSDVDYGVAKNAQTQFIWVLTWVNTPHDWTQLKANFIDSVWDLPKHI